jgi:hypothetical protein
MSISMIDSIGLPVEWWGAGALWISASLSVATLAALMTLTRASGSIARDL